MNNFTLKFDARFENFPSNNESCFICNYISGPFLTTRKFFLERLDTFTYGKSFHQCFITHYYTYFLASTINDDIVFIDFFTNHVHRRVGLPNQKNMTVLACRDVIFHQLQLDQSVVNLENLINKSIWLKFAQKFELNTIILPKNRHRLHFSCQDLKIFGCKPNKGEISPPCCLEGLSKALHFSKRIFDRDQSISIELEAGMSRLEIILILLQNIYKQCNYLGTNVGAVKLYGINPWEQDADLDISILPYKQIDRLIPDFYKLAYKLTADPQLTNETKCLWSQWVNCGYYSFRTMSYLVEFWGVTRMGSDLSFNMGLSNRLQKLITNLLKLDLLYIFVV